MRMTETMDTVSPLVDCGVHYVDVMCAMVGKKPVRVSGIGARLTDDLRDPTMYNCKYMRKRSAGACDKHSCSLRGPPASI